MIWVQVYIYALYVSVYQTHKLLRSDKWDGYDDRFRVVRTNTENEGNDHDHDDGRARA
ncbi:hypothetical protein RDWZM_003798 [Blomia tropicalis]|uniref:Uncharacterized protein n=1 Tax=Blomia tropicalis TaxID=40697 RepID=A0A9Q0MHL6_BLOTA|nr:hypothetical protein RDWZM_003798 [Blomia tropicalis]